MEMTFPLARSEGFENSSAGSGVRIPALTLESSIVFVLVDLGSLFTKQECHPKGCQALSSTARVSGR